MSSDRNPEVISCDASIMKNVWEIRDREFTQKLQLEEERLQKSALPSINQDWENRLAARMGSNYKRVERKKKSAEKPVDNDNIWKSKEPLAPPKASRGLGSAPHGRPGGQSRGFSTPAPNSNNKKVQDKNSMRLQSLMYIHQTQPSAMVWGKSWKNNKCLPLPTEGDEAVSNWGQCWMFATRQPYTEAGKPWLNGPNMVNPQSLYLWEKLCCRWVESQDLDLSFPDDEWQMSWRKYGKQNEDTSSANGENITQSGFFSMLMETQHRNEALSSSEWNESWRSTKPAEEQDHFSVANDVKEHTETSSEWDDCWRLVNHHGRKSEVRQLKKWPSPEWANSWRAAIVANNNNNSEPSLQQDKHNNYNQSQNRESKLHEIILDSSKQKYKAFRFELGNEMMAVSEWSKSWQVAKNNSKPSEEIAKVLKASPPKMETALENNMADNNRKGIYSTSEKTDHCYELLKHDVIYTPFRELSQSKMLHLKHLQNVLPASEWKESWKTLKHRMRMERRRMRPDPFRPFRGSDKGGDMKPTVSEWKDSWKFNCRSLHQEPQLWEQGWSTMPQIREERARDPNHFAPVELPKNGPTGERTWQESWRLSRHQRQSQPGQARAQTWQESSSVATHPNDESHERKRCVRPVSDWQSSWMVSETKFHHDRPSLIQWREAWKWSGTERFTEPVPRDHWVDALLEIQPPRRRISLQEARGKMSRSFEHNIFKERFPEKQWNASWRAGSSLNNQSNHHGVKKQHDTANGHGSEWGRSFRLANPMPQIKKPWVECSPNPSYYTVMWSGEKKKQGNVITNFINNPSIFKLWEKSNRFLQGVSSQNKEKTKPQEPIDPRVIITKKMITRRNANYNFEKEKQMEKKWAGCHLLGKTQPRPKRGSATAKKLKIEEKDEFFEEWAESWKFSARSAGGQKQKIVVKSLSGWDESWKFLIPPYQPTNDPKAKSNARRN